MIGTLIGAGIGLASSLIGSAQSRKQAKKAEGELNRQRALNEQRYQRLYNEDPTQTAAAQGALTAAREEALNMVKSARGMDATTGGNPQAMAAAQKAAGKMLADTTSAIAINGQNRKDAIDSDYQARVDNLSNTYYNLYNQRAANSAAAGAAGLQAGINLAGVDMQYALNSGRGLIEDRFRRNSGNA